MPPHDRPDAHVLREEQVERLYQQSPVGVFASLTVMLIFFGVLWPVASRPILLTWLVLMSVTAVFRFGLTYRYRKSANRAQRAEYWLRWFLVGTFISGMMWSLAIIFLVPGDSPLHLGFAILCVSSLTAGTVGAYSAVKGGFFAFSLPALLPGALYLLAAGDGVMVPLSLALFLFLGFSSMNALRAHNMVLQSLKLQLENTQLIRQIDSDGKRLADVDNAPEAYVVYGATELANTNEQPETEDVERTPQESVTLENEQRFRDLYDDTPSMFFTVDGNGTILSLNRYGAEHLGYRVDELVGKPIATLSEERAAAAMLAHIRQSLQTSKTVCRWDTCQVTKAGDPVWARVTARSIEDTQGRNTLLLVCEDITDHKTIEDSLRESENKFRSLVENIPAAVYRCDPNRTMEYIDQTIEDITGYPPSDFINNKTRTFASIVHPEDAAMVEDKVKSGVSGDKPYLIEYRVMHKEGRVRWVYEKGQASFGENRKVLWLDGAIFDVTDFRRLTDELTYQATHDDLTGLVNRREFSQRLKRTLDKAQADETDHALCYLDLDQFKIVNDTCGHVAGDQLLRELAALLQPRIRQRDTLARLGGDEFGVLMERCSLRDALRVAETLKRAVHDFQFIWDGKGFKIGVSMGLIPITSNAGSVTDILKAADAACYAAKDKGRNRIHVYHKDSDELAKWSGEMQWVTRINHALEDDRFRLYCQPIVAVNGVQSQGLHCELLMRLEDEEGSFVMPNAFVPAAERYGLNGHLDRWVIEKTTEFLSKPANLEQLSLCAINISGLTLSEREFLEFVQRQFEQSKVPPSKICFEITETAVISNFSNAIRFITALKERGCLFALDDFGSGLSSFAYLKRLPVDFLKIDGMFIRDIIKDPAVADIVRSINDIGHIMGKRTIAEFVSNDAILEKIREIGVDYAQGSAIGQTRPIEEMLKKQEHQQTRSHASRIG